MVFSSFPFLFIFLPLSLGVYYLIPARKTGWRNLSLLIGGLVFYAWGEPFYVLIMVFSTLLDYFAGLVMSRFDNRPKIRRLCLIFSVVMNLSLLGLFKYGGFFVTNVNSLFGLQLFNPKLPLPIGISFYTFQSMSYTIDLYRRGIKAQKNPVSFAAFVTMFPQIVAGPIVRYEDIAGEIDGRTVTAAMFADGIARFAKGMAKKVLLANACGQMFDTIGGLGYGNLPALTAWLGILSFTLQIYFDFSGYSDMAIGLGKMLGFNFPENFNYPYMAASVSDFWRRWHMTLGEWFKSYVYFPLGGSRRGAGRTVFNLAVVWILTGIWHGANWNFILWGTLYGLTIILEKLFLGKLLARLPKPVARIYTMFLVVLGWVLFSAEDLPSAIGYLGALFGSGNGGVPANPHTAYLASQYGLVLVCGTLLSTDVIKRLCARYGKLAKLSYPAAAIALAACVVYLYDASYNPFLYFNF